jgi:hypothetical protein
VLWPQRGTDHSCTGWNRPQQRRARTGPHLRHVAQRLVAAALVVAPRRDLGAGARDGWSGLVICHGCSAAGTAPPPRAAPRLFQEVARQPPRRLAARVLGQRRWGLARQHRCQLRGQWGATGTA